MRRRTRSLMADDPPPGLEARIAALEDPANQGSDFDAASWAWLIALGVVVPVALLIWGVTA
jgi:hypothetical protein